MSNKIELFLTWRAFIAASWPLNSRARDPDFPAKILACVSPQPVNTVTLYITVLVFSFILLQAVVKSLVTIYNIFVKGMAEKH